MGEASRPIVNFGRENEYCILLYHGVARDKNLPPGLNSSGKHVSESQFEEEMRYVSENYELVTMHDIASAHRGEKTLKPGSVAITFDDGFLNNYTTAYPILQRYSVPATIYLATGFIGENRAIWTDRLEAAFLGTKKNHVSVRWHDRSWEADLNTPDDCIELYLKIKAVCRRLPHQQLEKFVNLVIQELSPADEAFSIPIYRFLNWDQVREMAASGLVEFSAHTIDHVSLVKVPSAEMVRQIDGSIAKISEELGRPCDLFTYPEGQSHDYDQAVIDYLKSKGIDHCPNAVPGFNRVDTTNPFHIKRFMVGFEGRSFPLPPAREIVATSTAASLDGSGLPDVELFGRNLSRDLVVIAEVGVNHEGSPQDAMRMLELAAKAGAHAVKFQSYTPERFISADDEVRLQRVRRFQIDEDAHRSLARLASELGIAFCSSAISEDWVPLLSEIGSAIKIASGDITFEPVIRLAARSGRPVIISSGASTEQEIERAIGWIREECAAEGHHEQIVLLHCVSLYPTPIEHANILSVPYLREKFGVHVGWSNHVKEPEACLAAVALGANVVEVHFTDRREGREFHDHHLSFEPAELSDLIRSLELVRSSLGRYGKDPTSLEAKNIPLIRKGVVAARDLAAGTILARDDLMYARPATEFPAKRLPDLIGATVRDAVRSGRLIRRDNVEFPE